MRFFQKMLLDAPYKKVRSVVPLSYSDYGPTIVSSLTNSSTLNLPVGVRYCPNGVSIANKSDISIVGQGQSRLVAGVPINIANSWALTSQDSLYYFFPEAVRDLVRIIDLKKLGISSLFSHFDGPLSYDLNSGANSPYTVPTLMVNKTVYKLAASAKNHAWHVVDSVANSSTFNSSTAPQIDDLAGCWIQLFANSYQEHRYGALYSGGNYSLRVAPTNPLELNGSRFKILNSIQCLTQAGEYVYLYDLGIIAYIPLATPTLIEIGTCASPMLSFSNCENVSIISTCIGPTRHDAVRIADCAMVSLETNLFVGSGKNAITVFRTTDFQSSSNYFVDTSAQAIFYDDNTAVGEVGTGLPYPMPNPAKTKTWESHGVSISNNTFIKSGVLYKDRATVEIGPGTVFPVISENFNKDSSSSFLRAIPLGGQITDNTILETCRSTYDDGAIIINLSAINRGNVISGNFIKTCKMFQPISTPNVNTAIYLDDGACGATVTYNFIEDCESAFHNNGGRGHSYLRNVVKNCPVVQVMGTSFNLGLLSNVKARQFVDQCQAMVAYWNVSDWAANLSNWNYSDILALANARNANPGDTDVARDAALIAAGWSFASGLYVGYMQNSQCSTAYKTSDLQGTTPSSPSWNYGWTVNSSSSDNTSVVAKSETVPALPFAIP